MHFNILKGKNILFLYPVYLYIYVIIECKQNIYIYSNMDIFTGLEKISWLLNLIPEAIFHFKWEDLCVLLKFSNTSE